MSSDPTTQAALDAALAEFKDPETGRGVVAMGQVSNIQLAGDRLGVTLALTTYSAPIWDDVYASFEQHLRSRLPGLSTIQVERAVHDRPPSKIGEIGLTAKSVIAVG